MKISVRLPEEKLTDVEIGVELVDDFHHARCDLSVFVTNDADLQSAIAKVVTRGYTVHVVSPAATVNKHLARAATTSTPMASSLLEDHQLPDKFTIASGERFSKPNAWKTRKQREPTLTGGLNVIAGAVALGRYRVDRTPPTGRRQPLGAPSCRRAQR